MTVTYKLILFPVGGVVGAILALALKQGQILSDAFDSRSIALGFALGGLLLGQYIDNKRAKIAREQEGIEAPHSESALGRLLLSQNGATLLSSIYSVAATVLCWGIASLVLLTRLGEALSYLPHILIAVGAVSLMTILWRRSKSITCYERGVIVRKLFKSHTILHSDVAGVEFLALPRYNHGIFEGTTAHFEIIPRVRDAVKIRIWGSKQDGQRIEKIVELILTANPDAKLLKIRGVDDFN